MPASRGPGAVHARIGRTARRTAILIGGDRELADRVSIEVTLRASTRFAHLRAPEEQESFAMRVAAKLAARNERRHLDPSESAPLQEAWERLPARRRLALALHLVEEAGLEEIARVLQTSPRGAAWLVSTSLRRLPRGRSGDGAAELRSFLRARLEEAGPLPPLPEHSHRRILVRRTIALAVVVTALVGGTAIRSVWTPVDLRPAASPAPTAPTPEPARAVDVLNGCPAAGLLLEFDPSARRSAADAAVAFNRALVRSDRRAIARLSDGNTAGSASARPWSSTDHARSIVVTFSSPAEEDGLAVLSCGRAAARASWKVVVRDDSIAGAPEYAAFYLVKRLGGWRVWGSY